MPGRMSADHLAHAGGRWEPQRQYNWFFETMLTSGTDNEYIRLALESSALPNLTMDEIELNYQSERRWVAGKAAYENVPLVVKDMVDIPVANAIRKWSELVYNPITGVVNRASVYKKFANVILVAPDGTSYRTWVLIGAWPAAANYGTLDMTASDIVRIEMTIRYDKAIYLGSRLGNVFSALEFGLGIGQSLSP